MSKLWESEEKKLIKSGRKWKESPTLSYRNAELFCEECGVSLGIHDIVYTNLETMMYCSKCVTKYIKETPYELECGKIIDDYGVGVTIEYGGDYYNLLRINKVCYFNKKGRYIKVKGKRYYL